MKTNLFMLQLILFNFLKFNINMFTYISLKQKTDQNGNIVWSNTYGSIKNEYGKEVIQANDGGYFVVASLANDVGGDRDLYIIKTDANGFASGVGIKDNNPFTSTLNLYPNPFKDIVNVNLYNGNNIIEVFNSQGKLVFSETVQIKNDRSIKNIDLSQFPNAFYTIKITNAADVFVDKIIKN